MKLNIQYIYILKRLFVSRSHCPDMNAYQNNGTHSRVMLFYNENFYFVNKHLANSCK